MKIISINLARAKTINWKGTTLATAIFKEPVEGPVKVEPTTHCIVRL